MTRNRYVLYLAALATAVHALLFLATALYLIFLGRNDVAAVSWSLTFYYENASKVMAGMVPYRDFLFEYPILSLPLFLVPRLVVSDLDSYKVVFVVEMLLFDAAAIYLVARHVGEFEGVERVPARLGWYTLFCASLSPLLIGRFELAPMLLGFAAARWWFSDRLVVGGVTAGLGTLMKLFPGMVAAPALVWELSRLGITRAHGTAAFLGTLAIGVAIWFALGGSHVIDSLGYHANRGIEVESLYGGALFLAGLISRTDVPWVFEFKSYQVAPEWGARMATLVLPMQAAALVLVMGRFWWSGMTDGIRYAGAAILAFIITGKVLSPQYLIWLFPFVPVLGGPTGTRARWLFLVCCVTTAMIYPGPGFVQILDHQGEAIFMLNLRNLVLVALLGLLLFGSITEEPPAGTRSSGQSPSDQAPDHAHELETS